jgi:hypothetical protein
MKPYVAIAIPDSVGESFDFFGDGGREEIVAKEGGGAAVVGRGGVFEPFPGAGGFNWRISRISAGGLDRSLAVVGAHFPWGVFVLVCACAAEGVQDRNQVRGGEELTFLLQVKCHRWLCQRRDPYGQRYVGTHHVGCNSRGPLAVVPNSTSVSLLARPPNW